MAEKKKTAQFIPMTSTQAAIGGGVLIGFFALWFLWAAVGQVVLCWVEAHPGMASWIQAIGAILAFTIALIVYVDELRKRRKDELIYKIKHILFVKNILVMIKNDHEDMIFSEMSYKSKVQDADFYIRSLEGEASKMLNEGVTPSLIRFLSAFRVYLNYLNHVQSKLFSVISVDNEKEIIKESVSKYKNTFMPYCNGIILMLEKLENELNDCV